MSVSNDLKSIDKICRACLFQTEDMNFLNAIVESVEMSLYEVLMLCSKITENDELPNLMCADCTTQLLNAYNFKIKCEESDKILANYMVKKCEEIETFDGEPDHIDDDDDDDISQDPINIKIELEEIKDLQPNCELRLKDEHNSSTEPEITISFADEIQSDAKNKFHCDVCKNSYNHKKSLIRHLNKAHNANISNRCKICNKVFAKGTQLEAHMEKHTKNEAFICNTCDEVFETKLQLKTHHATHPRTTRKQTIAKNDVLTEIKLELNEVDNSLCMPNGTKIIQCKICREQFANIEKLKAHLSTHAAEDSFESVDLNNCELVKLFSPMESMERNEIISFIIKSINEGNLSKFYSISTQSGIELSLSDSETENDTNDDDDENLIAIQKYECNICYKIFNRRYKILYHQKNEHENNELEHQCTKCLWKFASGKLLTDHLRSLCDNENKQFSCNECNMRFMWIENLDLHKSSRHSVQAIRQQKKERAKEIGYVCETCDKKFVRYEHLERHKTIHLPNDKKFECTICKKKFNRKDNMRSHMRIHNANRNKDESDKHLCVYCGRSFTNSSNLIVHMRRHTGDKPYKCDFCGKGFPRSSDLQCHRRTHTGEKPCLCTICGKGFSRSNKLVRHMRIHTGIRPYKCTYCDRAFTQSNDLTLHIRRHTGDKPYVCGVCGDRFIQGTALQSHRRMKGHYEGPNHSAPFSSISVNNPNRMNFANRVDQIGLPKLDTVPPTEIKPVGRTGNFRTLMVRNEGDLEEDDVIPSAIIEVARSYDNVLSQAVSSVQLDQNDFFMP